MRDSPHEITNDWGYPLVVSHSYGKSAFSTGNSTISMAIFHSYPENCQGVSGMPNFQISPLRCTVSGQAGQFGGDSIWLQHATAVIEQCLPGCLVAEVFMFASTVGTAVALW